MTDIKYSVEFRVVKYKKYKSGAPKHLLKKGGRWQEAGEYGGFDNIDYVPNILTENKAVYEVAPDMYAMLERQRQGLWNLIDLDIIKENYKNDTKDLINDIDQLLIKARGES